MFGHSKDRIRGSGIFEVSETLHRSNLPPALFTDEETEAQRGAWCAQRPIGSQSAELGRYPGQPSPIPTCSTPATTHLVIGGGGGRCPGLFPGVPP